MTQPLTDPRIPLGRLDDEPTLDLTGFQRTYLLRSALRGVDPGRWDERYAGWLARQPSSHTVTVTSWIERGRHAERVAMVVDLRAQLVLVEQEWRRMPADERGRAEVEDAYRDGLLRTIATLMGQRPTTPAGDAVDGEEQ